MSITYCDLPTKCLDLSVCGEDLTIGHLTSAQANVDLQVYFKSASGNYQAVPVTSGAQGVITADIEGLFMQDNTYEVWVTEDEADLYAYESLDILNSDGTTEDDVITLEVTFRQTPPIVAQTLTIPV